METTMVMMTTMFSQTKAKTPSLTKTPRRLKRNLELTRRTLKRMKRSSLSTQPRQSTQLRHRPPQTLLK